MSSIIRDFKFGLQMLYKNLLTTVLVIVALGIGIGANTTIFSLMYSVLYMPIPMVNPDRLVRVYEQLQEGDGNDLASAQNFLEWKDQCKSVEGAFLVTTEYINIAGYGEPVRVPAYVATLDFFRYSQIPILSGRSFVSDDFKPGSNKVVVLNHGFWKEQFGSDPSIVNQTILLDREPYTVVGVFAKEMDVVESEARICLPLADDRLPQERGNRDYSASGWLKEGYTIEQAQKEFEVISSSLAAAYPEANKDWSIRIEPLLDQLYSVIEQTFITLYGAAGFVLLIVCSNVASLLLARASSRQREISIRVAMGAGRWQIFRQLLTESVVLSVTGGVFGVFVTIWGLEYLKTMLPGDLTSFLISRGVDSTMLVFTLSVSVLCGLLFGLVPAWQASKVNLNDALKEGGRSTGNQSGKHRILKTLVVSEVALALVLLIGAGLMINSFTRLQNVEPGFSNTGVLTGNVRLDDKQYGEEHQKRAFYAEISQRLQAVPGVKSVGISNVVPVTWGEGVSYEIDGQEPLAPGGQRFAQKRQINSTYFQTVGIPLLTGRNFVLADEQEQNHTIIVNQEFAEKNWGEESPVGKFVRIPNWSDTPFEVIGMVGNIRNFGFNSGFSQEIYIPYYTQPAEHISFAISANQSDYEKLASSIRQEFWAIDPNLPVNNFKTLDELLAENVTFQRFGVMFLTGFSFMALLLSSMGVFGIMSYTVSRQTHDIGIRMALGAQVNQVILMVVKQCLTLTGMGLCIGLVLSYLLKRVLESQLYGVSASDPLTYVTISLVLILISALACFIPARRAAKVNPITALRCE